MPRTDPRQTDGRADYLLTQLWELGQRRARVRDVDAATREKLTTLLTKLPEVPSFPNASPVTHGAHRRLLNAWTSDALRLIAKRDIEVVRSFLATVRMAA